MFKRFLPKQNNFFEILNELAESVLEAAKMLDEMMDKQDNFAEYSHKIHFIENRCDDLTHQVISDLNDTFITPIDREDIFALVNSMDDIVDTIDTIASRMSMYKLKAKLQFGPQLTDILLIQTDVLFDVVKNLQNPKQTTEKIVQVKTLETEGDIVFKDALLDLFENEKDVVELIKKKELLEIIERAVDKCQNAATVIEGILIKNM
ncbi:MAG TPA: DUF47 family protein [Ignavibacteria bacterium]|nr:DUF47 family protein [Ignavibacteria bacterium]HAX47645.1 hypothetical protein [Bacteroidota bacterium]HRE11080.1 DUF47 family protein [Ignavibacteria bacterium]HRF64931.1 DUF47 family protein [Ignavibacteria bacterium]HRJ05328.1 DUF47 family protein [Ignavibacteria bacterium]